MSRLSFLVSVHADTVGREEDVQDLLTYFYFNRPRLISTLHPPLIVTVIKNTNAEADGISLLI